MVMSALRRKVTVDIIFIYLFNTSLFDFTGSSSSTMRNCVCGLECCYLVTGQSGFAIPSTREVPLTLTNVKLRITFRTAIPSAAQSLPNTTPPTPCTLELS